MKNLTAQQYKKMTAQLRTHPKLVSILILFNNIITYTCYLLYPTLLAIMLFNRDARLLRFVLTPGIAFISLSIFRYIFNGKRPYEILDIEPLIRKDSKGKAFPSRHTFSAFMIAYTWFVYFRPVGAILFVMSAMIAVIRVLGGVHFPRDVAAGALFALFAGTIGFYLI